MKQIILVLSLLFFLISCNTINKQDVKQNLDNPYIDQNKIEEKHFDFAKKSENKKIGPTISYDIIEKNGYKILYFFDNGKKQEIEKTEGNIKDVIFDNKLELLIYKVLGTGGEIIKIYDIKNQKNIGKLFFGKFTLDKKYIYSCKDSGMGSGDIGYFDITNKKYYSYNEQLGIGTNGNIIYDCYFDYMNDILYFKSNNKSYSLNMNKNKLSVINELIDINQYSKEEQPAIKIINNMFIKKLKQNQVGKLKIIKLYKKRVVVYAKDDKNYYYFCNDWPSCEQTFEKHPIKEGKLEIIDKLNYRIGNKEYLNKYEEGFRKMEEDRLQNQVIIKYYGDGLVLKQDTKGFMYDQLGRTILYLNGKELISLANNLSTINCDGKPLNVCQGKEITDELIRKKTVEKFGILKNSDDVLIDKNANIKVLYIYGYEGHEIYFIDIKNEKIIKDKLGGFIKSIKQGKSGTFILEKGGRGCLGGLVFISNKGNIEYLFENKCDEDLDDSYKEIIDFELMINKQVKIFYKSSNGEDKEKIINITG